MVKLLVLLSRNVLFCAPFVPLPWVPPAPIALTASSMAAAAKGVRQQIAFYGSTQNQVAEATAATEVGAATAAEAITAAEEAQRKLEQRVRLWRWFEDRRNG